MGNIFAASADLVPQRPPRAVDTDAKERRQVYREAKDARVAMAVLRRRATRALLRTQFVNRPVTFAEMQEMRSIVLEMAPACSDPGTCTLPIDARSALAIIESSEGRSLSLAEARLLTEFITDDKPVEHMQHSDHPNLVPISQWSTCECGVSSSCSECSASAFRPVAHVPDLPLLDIQYKSSSTQGPSMLDGPLPPVMMF